MGRWERSWWITRSSFDVLMKDKEMLWFPILSGFFSLLFSAALLVPTFVLDLLKHTRVGGATLGPVQIVAVFATYFGLSFIATFFNVCVVYTTRVRLDGGDATFGESIAFAFSRLHLIVGWSLLSASVGILLQGIESMARRSGLIGKILLSIVRAMLAGAWSIMTVFVVPSMVYRGTGPMEAIRDSFDTLKRTWGESVIGYYGVGIASYVCALPGILLVVAGVALLAGGTAAGGTAPVAGVVALALGVLVLAAASLVFGVISTIYKTALYHFATTGQPPSGFEAASMSNAFR